MLAYFVSAVLQGTRDAVAPGSVSLTLELLPVTTLKTLLTIFGGAIISRRMLGSVVSGKPLSIISSRSYNNITTLHLNNKSIGVKCKTTTTLWQLLIPHTQWQSCLWSSLHSIPQDIHWEHQLPYKGTKNQIVKKTNTAALAHVLQKTGKIHTSVAINGGISTWVQAKKVIPSRKTWNR